MSGDPYAQIAAPAADAPVGDPYAGIGAAAQPAAIHTFSTRTRNGKIVSFQAPSDADDATVRQLAAKATGSNAYLRSDVKRDGTPLPVKSGVIHGLGVFLNGAVQGASDLQDLITGRSVANTLTGAITGYKPPSSAEIFASPLESNGIAQPETSGQNILFAAGKGAGSAGPFGVEGGLAGAGLGVLSGAAGGASGEIAKQAGAGTLGQLAASVVGGGIAGIGASAARQSVSSAADAFTRGGAMNAATRTLRSVASDPVAAAGSIRYAPQPVSGAAPTMAEVAGDAGLAGFQRGHVSTTPSAASAVGERYQLNALARTAAVDSALGPGSPQQLQNIGAARVASAQAATAADRAQAGIRLRDVANGIGPITDRAATGATARQAFGTAYDQAKDATRAAYSEPAAVERTPVEIPNEFFQSIRKTADDFYGDGGGTMPPEMASILDDVSTPNATTRTLANIEGRLSDFAGQARNAGRNAEAAFAGRIRDSLAQQTDALITPERKAALGVARSARADQGRVFETGDAADAFRTNRFGNPVVDNTSVPTKLVRPGAPGGDTADGLIASVGQASAERIAREEMRRLAEGSTPAQARTLLRNHSELLSRFPVLRSDMEGWASRLEQETAATRATSPQEAALADTPLSRVAAPTVEPSSYVARLLRQADGGRELKQLAGQVGGDAAATNGLRRSMADFIQSEGTGKAPTFTASGDAVPRINPTRAAIRTVLERGGGMLSNEQKTVLDGVSRELESANFANSAGRPAGSDTAMNLNFLGRHAVGLAGPKAILLHKVLSVFTNENQVRQLLTKAILEPDFAATLLERQTPERLSALTRAFKIGTVSGGVSTVPLHAVGAR